MSSAKPVTVAANGIPEIPTGPGKAPQPYSLDLKKITEGYDRQTCWVQARAGAVPSTDGSAATVVATMQKLELAGSDIFFDLFSTYSTDLGETWSELEPQAGIKRHWMDEKWERVVCDFYPKWHKPSGKLLGIGHTAWYLEHSKLPRSRPRETGYAVYDPDSHTWSDAQYIEMPDSEGKFQNAGSGCSQRVDLPNGDVLVPIYFRTAIENYLLAATVLRCSFDGQTLKYIEHGTELHHDIPRGFGEPSLTTFNGRYFLTLRNDKAGWVTSGPDGLTFDKPIEWKFDDGQPLGNYNTQQHWVTHSDALYLVYTRRGLNNDHVFRHRGPLVMGQVDPDKLCVIRDTEQIIVPDRGARLGNYGIVDVSPDQTWVIVAEWMQTSAPDSHDYAKIESYGANNTVWAARIHWDKPNALAL